MWTPVHFCHGFACKARLAQWSGVPHSLYRGKDNVCGCRFTYQLLQGYDFVHLNREHGVRLQVHPSLTFETVRGSHSKAIHRALGHKDGCT